MEYESLSAKSKISHRDCKKSTLEKNISTKPPLVVVMATTAGVGGIRFIKT